MPRRGGTRVQEARDRSAANTVRIDAGGTAFDLNACAGSEVALGESRLRWQSSFSQLRLSETGESNFHLQQRRTLHATSSSTLSNSTNGWLTWQQRSLSEDARY